MLSSINWLRQLIARDQAKQPQLKNQLTKSHKLSQPTIGRDIKQNGGLYMVALSGTLLVVYQICAAEHDIFLFSRGDTCILPK
jgi:hypothetical protein